jgi:hypothetical protein
MWPTPAIFRERLGERAGRQRTMAADGHLLIILHALPKPGDPDREAVLFWRAPDGAWTSNAGGAAPGALDAFVGGFEAKADELETRLDTAKTARDFHDVLAETTPLVRTVRNQHAALQEAREAVPGDRRILLARDRSGEVLRAVELLNQEAQNSMQYLIAEQSANNAAASERLAQTGHRLNLLAALFLPLTAIGSILGMNLRHGFEDRSPALFWLVLGAGLLCGLLVKAAVASSMRAKPAGKTVG